MEGLWWSDPIYMQVAALVLCALGVIGVSAYFLKRNDPTYASAWASAQSWVIFAPIILFFLGLTQPWAHIFLVILALGAAKLFFKMTGMFHRSNFVWMTYISIVLAGYLIHENRYSPFMAMPMILFGCVCTIPIYRNSFRRMIQYIGLTLINFMFIWGFMHLGFILHLAKGTYALIYIVLLTELCDMLHLGFTRYFGKHRIASRLSNKRTIEGFSFAICGTLVMAWAFRHLLPAQTTEFWVSSGLIAAVGGGIGDMIMAVIRRDLGIKVTGAFILGRSDYLTRIDRLIFVAPLFYHLMLFLLRREGLA